MRSNRKLPKRARDATSFEGSARRPKQAAQVIRPAKPRGRPLPGEFASSAATGRAVGAGARLAQQAAQLGVSPVVYTRPRAGTGGTDAALKPAPPPPCQRSVQCHHCGGHMHWMTSCQAFWRTIMTRFISGDVRAI